MKKTGSIIIMLLFIGISVNAQCGRPEMDFDEDWEDFMDWEWNGSPLIKLDYGIGAAKHKALSGNLAKTGFASIELGYSKAQKYSEDYLLKLKDSYLFVSNSSVDLNSNKDTKDQRYDLLRFGGGFRSGYGYKTEYVNIIPYTQNSVVWSKLKAKDPLSVSNDDLKIIDRFHDSFRFGTSSEAGLSLQFADFISVNGSYEASVVFPRHLVWKHLGSFAIEGIAVGSLDLFIKEIIDSSPAAGPFINVILKGGLMYAFHTLKKDKMNWPFATEKPLTYETFKVGMTFTF